ncbi:NADP-dependent oxidoreductase [Echinicola sp. 20G]|uniref:NADP-dependent oxidoreductase n=1 Tax=Echinicola sp. 20G TaxID=2781961 RepID=UPI00191000A2|nr:NADP-dependent oxidoreductase [Echinicola sp. 20G]
MKAIIIEKPGDVGSMKIVSIKKPLIQKDEVLIKTKAIGINPVDVKSRAGKGVYGRLKDIHPLILGWDISGVVVEVGDAVTDFSIGDEVFGMVNFPGHGQAYAEYVAAPAYHLALKPSNISHIDAAATTLAALTAFQAMTHQFSIKPGNRVLIHAASGGVGHFAVQLAKHFGAYVIGTSSAANREFVLGLGADEHIDYRSKKFEEATSDIDFVLDTIGGQNIDRSLEVVKPGGTIISIPTGLNAEVTQKAKNKGVNGFFFLVQSNGTDMKALAKLLEDGYLKPHLSASFPFVEMTKAHELQETGHVIGKLVVTLDD